MRRRIILKSAALLLSVLPPLIAVLSYFPLWREAGAGTVLSGFTALLLVMAFFPLFKLLRRMLESPSAWVMWLISFLLFFALSRISEQMIVISFIGTLSNAMGAVLYRIAGKAGALNE